MEESKEESKERRLHSLCLHLHFRLETGLAFEGPVDDDSD